MTEKETVGQMLRRWAKEANTKHDSPSALAIDELYSGVKESEECLLFEELVRRIEAESWQACREVLEKSFCEGIAWRIANMAEYGHLPRFKEEESVVQWLDRCFLRKPLVDGEPLANGMKLEGMDGPIHGFRVHDDGSGEAYGSGRSIFFPAYDDPDRDSTLHLKRPEVLDADGVPIKVGDTVYVVPEHKGNCGSSAFIEDCFFGLNGIEYGVGYKVLDTDHCGNVVLEKSNGNCPPAWLTHKEPDTQERIDADARKNAVEYWGCGGFGCNVCPVMVDGEKPHERYGVPECETARILDILRRQRELDERLMGGAK